MSNQSLTATIAQLPLLEQQLLSGEDSIEITIATRIDGGEGFERKSFRTTLNSVLGIYAIRRDNPNEVTAEQVGAYTIEQVKALLEEKLGIDGIAVNSLKLDGYTRQEIVEEARQGTVNDAHNLGGKPAADYLLVDQFETALVDITEVINDMTDSITL